MELSGRLPREVLESMSEGRQELIRRYHTHELEANQCGNIHAQIINAPLEIVWSVVRRFEKPQMYKKFIQSCSIIEGTTGTTAATAAAPPHSGAGEQAVVDVGSIREVQLVSGIPATSSVERLEILDDAQHIFSFRILGGAHRLQNYCSVTSLHNHQINGKNGTLLLESYVVNIPEGNTTEETLLFVDTVVRCNLKSLSQVTERRTLQLQQLQVNHDQLSSGSPLSDAAVAAHAGMLPRGHVLAASADQVLPPSSMSHRLVLAVTSTTASGDVMQAGVGMALPSSNLQGKLAVDLRHCGAAGHVVLPAAPPVLGGNRGLMMGQVVDLKQGGGAVGMQLAKVEAGGGERTVEQSAAVRS